MFVNRNQQDNSVAQVMQNRDASKTLTQAHQSKVNRLAIDVLYGFSTLFAVTAAGWIGYTNISSTPTTLSLMSGALLGLLLLDSEPPLKNAIVSNRNIIAKNVQHFAITGILAGAASLFNKPQLILVHVISSFLLGLRTGLMIPTAFDEVQ
jgi:hypothetical protein